IPSLRSAAERGRMTWQLNLFARVCDLASDYFQDRDVAIEKISDVRVSAVGRKDDTFSKSPEFNVAYFCNLLAINLKYRCAAILAREKCIFIGVPGYQNRESQVALWADGEAFRRVANRDLIDDTRRACIEVNHAHRIDVAIGGTSSSVVCNQRDVAARRNVNIVRKDTGGHIVLLVTDLSTVDLEERHFVND